MLLPWATPMPKKRCGTGFATQKNNIFYRAPTIILFRNGLLRSISNCAHIFIKQSFIAVRSAARAQGVRHCDKAAPPQRAKSPVSPRTSLAWSRESDERARAVDTAPAASTPARKQPKQTTEIRKTSRTQPRQDRAADHYATSKRTLGAVDYLRYNGSLSARADVACKRPWLNG